jgi:hypothetical protein
MGYFVQRNRRVLNYQIAIRHVWLLIRVILSSTPVKDTGRSERDEVTRAEISHVNFVGAQTSTILIELDATLDTIQHLTEQTPIPYTKEVCQLRGALSSMLEIRESGGWSENRLSGRRWDG